MTTSPVGAHPLRPASKPMDSRSKHHGAGVAITSSMLLPLLAALTLATPELSSPPLLTAEGTRWGEEQQFVRSHPLLGVELDAGFPDGAAAGILVMPVSFLRLQLAGLTNGLGTGARLGVELVAFPTWVLRPTLGVEGGYTFGGVGAWALGSISDDTLRAALSKVTVGFVTARAGLELGSKTFALTLQAGVSWIDVNLGSQAINLGSGVSLKATGSSLRGFVPSARVGLLFCFG